MAFVVISAVTHQDLLQQDHVKTFFLIIEFWYFQGHFDEQSFMDEIFKKKEKSNQQKKNISSFLKNYYYYYATLK